MQRLKPTPGTLSASAEAPKHCTQLCAELPSALQPFPKGFSNIKCRQSKGNLKGKQCYHEAILSVQGWEHAFIPNKHEVAQFSQFGWWLAQWRKWKVGRFINDLVCPASIPFWSVWNISTIIINLSNHSPSETLHVFWQCFQSQKTCFSPIRPC